jgi:DNA-binding response OmpR family regulator
MKILIIEDEEGIVEFIRDGLKSEGYQVDFTLTGEEGLLKARENCYDLILIDLILPDLHGAEICKKLAEEENPAARIVLTAKHELKTKLEAFQNGVDDYVTKPFSFEELLLRVKAVLKRRKQDKNSGNSSNHSLIKIDNRGK